MMASASTRTVVAVVAILLLLGPGFCTAQEAELNDRVREWTADTVSRLRRFKPDQETKTATVEFEHGSFRVTLHHAEDLERSGPGGWIHQGLLRFPNDDWIYLVSMSSHLGFDVTVAVDQRGTVYTSHPHYCPVLVLVPPRDSSGAIRSLQEFLMAKTVCAEGLCTWQAVQQRAPDAPSESMGAHGR